MAGVLLPVANFLQAATNTGAVLDGGKLYVYTAGTVTPVTVYKEKANSTSWTSPIVLDSAGRLTSPVWGTAGTSYKFILKTSADVTIGPTWDDVSGINDSTVFTGSATYYGGTAGGTADALTLTFSNGPSALASGQIFIFKAASTNTGAMTLNPNGLGVTNCKKQASAAMVSGDVVASRYYVAFYDGTNMLLDELASNPVSRTGAEDVAGVKNFTSGPTVSGTGVMLQGVHTIPVLASAMFSRTTNGAAAGMTELATNDVMLATKDFDQTTSEGVQFYIPAPKSWNESTVTAQFGWTAASGTGTAIWSISASAFSDDDAMDAAFGSAQTSTDTLLTANDLHISPVTSAITIGGTPAESDFVVFQITRDISDTLNADAKLIWCKVFLTYTAGNDA